MCSHLHTYIGHDMNIQNMKISTTSYHYILWVFIYHNLSFNLFIFPYTIFIFFFPQTLIYFHFFSSHLSLIFSSYVIYIFFFLLVSSHIPFISSHLILYLLFCPYLFHYLLTSFISSCPILLSHLASLLFFYSAFYSHLDLNEPIVYDNIIYHLREITSH